MAIRWDEFPHGEIRLKIYARLDHCAVGRSAEDSLRHILRRRLAFLDAEDHRRFIELEARNLVEHLRCTRDLYREFVEKHDCRPILEALWVVLRCAVFPTAVALLRSQVIEYAKLTRIPRRDLSLLFGILTRTCYQVCGGGIALVCAPDVGDDAAATDKELQSKLLLRIRSMREKSQHLASEYAAEHSHGQEEAGLRCDPAEVIEGQSSGGSQVVQVGMMAQVRYGWQQFYRERFA